MDGILQKNPFTTAEELFGCFCEKLTAALDEDVEEYINGDSYYPPEMMDYYGEDTLRDCCGKIGLEVLFCDCSGETSDFMPDFR